MTKADIDRCIRQLIGGDAAAAADVVDRARTSRQPIVLVAAALIAPTARHLLNRANGLATTTRDRQLVAVAAAHLDGDHDRVDALARDHLVDFPDSILVAWIAAAAYSSTRHTRWSAWLVAFAVLLLRRPRHAATIEPALSGTRS